MYGPAETVGIARGGLLKRFYPLIYLDGMGMAACLVHAFVYLL